MSSHMRQEVDQPWRFAGRVWCEGLLRPPVSQQALLDHQEFVGQEMGRARILQALQRPWHVRDQ